MTRSNNPNIGKLLSAMKKLIKEVNDQEICRRLEILMNSEKEDLSAGAIRKILETPESIDAKEIPEPYPQYVKHYIYMLKREARDKVREVQKEQQATEARLEKEKSKKTTKKKAD